METRWNKITKVKTTLLLRIAFAGYRETLSVKLRAEFVFTVYDIRITARVLLALHAGVTVLQLFLHFRAKT